MKIVIVTPAPPRVRNGNRNTAQRWAAFLRRSGHRVVVQVAWDGIAADLMLALHARRSYASIKRFSEERPAAPLIVVLTGTDLYRDIRTDSDAQESMRLATRLVVLQEMGLNELAPDLRLKTLVVHQSARPVKPMPPLKKTFEICVIGNLREEKDPFRSALASALLPAASKIHIRHLGRALNEEMAHRAAELTRCNPRYSWLGECPHGRVRKEMARCRLMVVSSIMEGGANVISEALSADVPVIASDIPGNQGMLGTDYSGFFSCGDERALAEILFKAETDATFYATLKAQCQARKPCFNPEREHAQLDALITSATLPTDAPGLPLREGIVF